ncbi:hypothetical protein TVAG_493770 [Trichomonas vaginalis G3]|uniref:receptor protein-tyrosine kinase n=1 Tax=Trichomonas vaginalis (strain ATCC PRA-98 / G3) TaxID=412133 RepID=A2DQ08_TRIV3|nr:glycine-rich protein family [Trichomonas vaginalis G3]EAY17435.1 hypothetical protein TVAG_493770 [Trichomonas vaginalis G3]KAI5533530.1 glycine-rich protein family [Trichomonas vaginalis G3]|eukprot:XP_001329570.1 hypothetical protein [Trichomonas vaginalis G3]
MNNLSSGLGAFTEAVFHVKSQTKLNIYVGSHGQCSTTKLTSNFFQAGINDIFEDKYKSCTGGGSTFISVNDSKNDVLIVAGSGGGSGQYHTENSGGYGGYIGGIGLDLEYFSYYAGGGTQNQGGSGSHFENGHSSCDSLPGSFLRGGDGASCWSAASGGGGGGYYGGGGGVDLGGGGGGSSFARGDLTSVTFRSGNETFKSPSGKIETGHSGNGFIIIQQILPRTVSKACFGIEFSPYLIFILFDSK